MTTSAPTDSTPPNTPSPAPLWGLDTTLAATSLAAGIVLAGSAVRANPRAFILFAGLEGSVALVILAGLIVMASGLRPRTMLAALSPIIALQMAYLIWRRLPFMAPLGIELTALGAIALIATWTRRLVPPKIPDSPRSHEDHGASQRI